MKNNKLILYLAPSWISNLVGITAGVLLSAGVIILEHYQGSELRQQIFEVNSRSAAAPNTSAYHTVSQNFADNHILGVAPLFLIWAGVGLAVYFITIAIVNALQQVTAIRDQLGYVHTSRQALIRQLLYSLLFKVLAAIAWLLFIVFSLRVGLPYAIALASIAAHGYAVSNLLYGVLAVIVVYAVVYGHAVLLRLVALRPRLFGN